MSSVEDGLTYVVEDMDLSMTAVLAKVVSGLNITNAGTESSGFEGGIVMLLRVPKVWGELVEDCSKRAGLHLTRWEGPDEA